MVNRVGRERILSDVFLDNVVSLKDGDVSFISFDFHEHCRGMRFENVALLMDSLQVSVHLYCT